MKRRLDLRLVDQGLAESRQKAQALVMAGRVRVNGEPASKAGASVAESATVELVDGPRHVGRGAVKLAGALEILGVDPAGRVAVDVGASTGGFTEVLLARGARKVYAVDVGRGQLHERLRGDQRVHTREGVNARALSRTEVPEACEIATVDVSFISALKILPALRSVLTPGADVVVLVKPQFELGRFQVGRGVVRDPELHYRALAEVAGRAQAEHGYAVAGACASPLPGAAGNREFFLHLKPAGTPLEPRQLERLVRRVVQP